MGLEIVVKDIQEGARAEVSRIKAEGDAKASEILNEAKEVQKKTLGDSLAKAEEDLQNLHQQVISSANLEVKRITLNKRKDLLDKVYVQTVEKIKSMPASKKEELLKTILSKYEASGARVYSSKDSEDIVKKLTSLSYAGNIGSIGGVILENEDGTVRLDFTYDSILKNVYERSLKQISDILYG
ncbi:MAG: V-type ATP synthase subunit E [Methanosarcina vacuolata]|jgi:V/A-type H+-transporting ATPase subunit E|uniref:A-type ATP synthase subunit E n=1 Tax=Methanosarcina vacuolata Z-761 TaxID=1434123 RepID=A0A0E3Q8N7_9EURY|nr:MULTISPECIES: V-type ATP synthase subunit E [Methanosarcina]AKB45240.1 V-type ATP synthase subunit E [Methanosarcina vacuolata Z-761]AKB48725.1 V-type ATP synthase subunit E [Methanosarcina sp. Kolksee]MCC4766003.1 V-type ATP synthase subunit E [Methanosarcina sp. DH1]MDY0129168.1 V-type ATP synthase subunit E [Methanosarcina vacuolata]